MADFKIKGGAELQKLLDTLPAKMEANVVRGSLRAGAKVLLEETKRNAPVDSGEMRDGLKITTRNKSGRVSASVKAAGPHGFIANFIEYGTAPHVIAAKDGGRLSFGGAFLSAVDHPGLQPRAFMRPALDTHGSAAILAAAEYMKKRLSTKHGIDTADIEIGVDEE